MSQFGSYHRFEVFDGHEREKGCAGRPARSRGPPPGHRIALTVRGKDYTYPGGSGGKLSNMKNEFTGVGPFLHNDARDRPPAIFDGEVTLHTGGAHGAWVMLPVIPAKGS